MVIVAMVVRWWRSDDTEVTVGRTVVVLAVIVVPPWSLWWHCGDTDHCGLTVVVVLLSLRWHCGDVGHCGGTVVVLWSLWWHCGGTVVILATVAPLG